VSRHLAIGDIHGCVNALRSLVELISPHPDDTIVMLGDYVDRGPDSARVLDFVIELGETRNLVPLRGNHEIMMLEARDKTSCLYSWLGYGGKETLRSYPATGDDEGPFATVPDAHFDFLENSLVSYHECETHFFVHANADANVALDDQSEANLYWRTYKDPARHCSDKIMVCGHTVQHSGWPVVNDNSICIDTGVYDGGWLTCLDVRSGTFWQANEAGETRTFTLDEVKRQELQ